MTQKVSALLIVAITFVVSLFLWSSAIPMVPKYVLYVGGLLSGYLARMTLTKKKN